MPISGLAWRGAAVDDLAIPPIPAISATRSAAVGTVMSPGTTQSCESAARDDREFFRTGVRGPEGFPQFPQALCQSAAWHGVALPSAILAIPAIPAISIAPCAVAGAVISPGPEEHEKTPMSAVSAMTILPILAVRVPADIRHNIAPERQVKFAAGRR
jgi:hypothetical protein